MRIAISVDMEGISGTVSFKQIVAGNPEFERAQRLATADVNAAIAGAREAGATRFFIHDTHWLDQINLLIDELDESAEYVGGQPLLLWEDLDANYGAAFLIGYHARAGQSGIMSHVFSDLICDIRLNGRSVGEGMLAAALAGYYGIPTILVTGDDHVSALPYAVWMMRGFFLEIPREIEESALVDGCSPLGAFWRIALPLVTPGLVATGVFCFIFAWSELFFAVCLTRTDAVPLSVHLPYFFGKYTVFWGEIGASSIIAMAPLFLMSIVVQRYLVRGLTLGAVK